MNILFLSAEVAPFVSVGGLSQVMFFLPRALASLEHDVRIFTPKYGKMDETAPERRPWHFTMEMEGLRVPTGDKKEGTELICNIKSIKKSKKNTMAYFLENQEYYELRANVFGYKDDHIRFALLCRGCLEWLLGQKKTRGAWMPDMIHCNDWHAAYFIDLARRDERYRSALSKIPLVLTVHNFMYQGNYDFRYAPKNEKDDGKTPLADVFSPKLQQQNALKRGLLYADAVTTVSPTHAIEVLTPEFSEGLDDILQGIRSKLTGILNGVDTKEFDSVTDPFISNTYTVQTVERNRFRNKREIQKEFSLPVDGTAPLCAFTGRLAAQKGVDLILETLPNILTEVPNLQIILLGSGEDRYRKALIALKETFPKQIGLHLRSDFRLPRKLFSSADIFLIPSVFEPGGIIALEAMRYGAVPLVHRTGGLNDIITDFDPETRKGNGISFTQNSPWSFYGALIEALTYFKQPALWKRIMENGMKSDFSWEHAAKLYEQWYRKTAALHRRAIGSKPHPAYKESLA